MALISIVFAALGTAIGSTLQNMQGFQLIMNFLVMPIFFLSGALFPLTNLPTALTVVTRLDPADVRHRRTARCSHRDVALRDGDQRRRCSWCVAAAFLALGAYSFSKIQI